MSSPSEQSTIAMDATGDSLANRYLAAWSSHRGDAVAAFMSADVDFEEVTLGERLHGHLAVADFVERFTTTFSSDYHFQLVAELATPDGFAVEWTVSGHHDRDAPALPATHQPFTIRGATVAHLTDGKIDRSRDYWDMASFLRDVGLLPTPLQ